MSLGEGRSPSAAEHAAAAVTWLFVPGSRPDRFEKAAASGADAILIDLEDAVAPADKAAARRSAVAWLASQPAYVRVNGTGTPFFAGDVDALAAGAGALRGVVLPKAERAEQLGMLDGLLPAGAAVIALVETSAGILAAAELARAPRVRRLAFGSVDLVLETGIEDERGLLPARCHLVLASRAAGLAGPIDGVTTALDDPGRVEADAQDARRLGFAGKLCIHPRQVPAAARGFAPSPGDVTWARRVLDAASGSAGAAVRVDGEMVDAPRLARARAIWERHRRLGSAEGGRPGTSVG